MRANSFIAKGAGLGLSTRLVLCRYRAVHTPILIVDYSAGRLPVSFPRSIATAPAFYNYFKGGRSMDPGVIYPNGSLRFGHQVNGPRCARSLAL